MGFSSKQLRPWVAACLLSTSLFSAENPSDIKLQALFLMQQNKTEESLQRYKEYVKVAGRQDFETLQQMGFTLLQKGIQSDDPQVFIMTLFGSGLSGAVGALEILEKGILQPDPQTQLMALHFISQIEEDKANDLLNLAMSSDFLSTRMEAAYYLSLRKHPHAVGQIEGLMFRLPPAFKPFFPSLFALIGNNDATQALRRLIEDSDAPVRIESILQVARLGRDDFLPLLRKKLTHTHVAELESAAYAIGVLKDTLSIPKLRQLASSPSDSVRIAATLALMELGDRSYLTQITDLAKKHNLFAIGALGFVSGSEEPLASLAKSSDLQVRVNAAVALLQRRDSRCLPGIAEILISDVRDLAFQPTPSLGRSLSYLKAIPSAELRAKDPSIDLTFSLAIRERLLQEALHLPEDDFLTLAMLLMQKQQSDLVPSLIALLENLQTEKAKGVLKLGAAKIAHPLIRDYCHLSLYRLKEEGPYEEYINRWIMKQKEAELIRLRPILPWKFRLDQNEHVLTPEETSKLLIDAFISVASRRDEKSISFLLEAIRQGNVANRYALMGLLMKATE